MKRLLVLTICFIFMRLASGWAEPFHSVELLPRHKWELGTEVSYITYKEPGVMKNKGMMYGILGSYTYRGWESPAPETQDKRRETLEARFSWGKVDYSSEGTGSLDNIDDYLGEVRGIEGYEFPVFEASTIIPYIGVGYRYLNNDISGMTTTTGHLGYERESNYLYSPIGIEFITDLEGGWSLGATLEYDIFWWGKQKSHLSDVVASCNDLENEQKKGYGCRGSIKLEKRGQKLDFVIEPFIRYWNIKKSEEQALICSGVIWGYGYEPKNRSTEFGVKVTARF